MAYNAIDPRYAGLPYISLAATGTFSVGDKMKVSGDHTVARLGTTDAVTKTVGTAANSGVSGDTCALVPDGELTILSSDGSGAITAGDGLTASSTSAGKVVTSTSAIMARALGSAPATAGASVYAISFSGGAGSAATTFPLTATDGSTLVFAATSSALADQTPAASDYIFLGAPIRCGKNLGVSEKLYFAAGTLGYDIQMKHANAGSGTTTICDWWFMASDSWAANANGGDFVFFSGLGVTAVNGVAATLGTNLEGAYRFRLGNNGDDLNGGISALDLQAVGGYLAQFGIPVAVVGATTVATTTNLTAFDASNSQNIVCKLRGSVSNRWDFSAAGLAAPTFTTRSAGEKLTLYNSLGAADVGFGAGVESNFGWLSASNISSTQGWKFYAGTTEYARATYDITNVGGMFQLFGTGEEIKFNSPDVAGSFSWIRWFAAPNNQTGFPNKTTRSHGTRLIFYPLVDTVNTDYGIGLGVDGLGHVANWYSSGVPHGRHYFYSCDAVAAVISDNLLGFYGSAGVAQPTAAALTTGFTAHASANAVYNESTWTGNTGSSAYTVGDIVKALKDTGIIAA